MYMISFQNDKLTVTIDMGHTRDVYSLGVMSENLLEYLTELGLLRNGYMYICIAACQQQEVWRVLFGLLNMLQYRAYTEKVESLTRRKH
jgi:hypothetical protein